MSSHEPPNDRPRWSDDDATRAQDATSGGQGPPQGSGAEDRTQHLDAVPGRGPEPLEATVHHGQGGPAGADPYGTSPYGGDERGYDPDGRYGARPEAAPPAEEPPKKWGKGAGLILLGLVLGFIIALVVVALGTDDTSATGAPSSAALERIDQLEAEIAEREAQIDDLQARVDAAEADAGEADEAVARQREALDIRSEELESVAGALTDREEAVAERERQIAAREEAVADRERAADAGEPAPDDGDGGFDLPELDDEDVDGFIDQLLDQIRDLF